MGGKRPFPNFLSEMDDVWGAMNLVDAMVPCGLLFYFFMIHIFCTITEVSTFSGKKLEPFSPDINTIQNREHGIFSGTHESWDAKKKK